MEHLIRMDIGLGTEFKGRRRQKIVMEAVQVQNC